jgi:hypothetical protein
VIINEDFSSFFFYLFIGNLYQKFFFFTLRNSKIIFCSMKEKK